MSPYLSFTDCPPASSITGVYDVDQSTGVLLKKEGEQGTTAGDFSFLSPLSSGVSSGPMMSMAGHHNLQQQQHASEALLPPMEWTDVIEDMGMHSQVCMKND